MFRRMRRFRQQLSDNESAEILENGRTGILGVVGDGGYPYTVPLNFVFWNSKIYFHCAKTGHKIDAIMQNDKVSFCVIDKDDVVPEKFTTYFRSVVIFGRAVILEDREEFEEAICRLAKKYSPKETDASVAAEIAKGRNSLCMVSVDIEHITGKECIELIKK